MKTHHYLLLIMASAALGGCASQGDFADQPYRASTPELQEMFDRVDEVAARAKADRAAGFGVAYDTTEASNDAGRGYVVDRESASEAAPSMAASDSVEQVPAESRTAPVVPVAEAKPKKSEAKESEAVEVKAATGVPSEFEGENFDYLFIGKDYEPPADPEWQERVRDASPFSGGGS